MFNVNADLFRAVALFQSTEATRYYLAGVHIEPCPMGGAIMVATDGHRALVAHDPDGSSDGRYIVSLDKAALAACKADRREVLPRRVTSTDPKSAAWVTRADGDQIHPVKDWLVDGTFPDWRRVLPKIDAPAFAAFDSALLSDFYNVARILSDSRTGAGTCISIATNSAEGPSLIKFAASDAVFGILMPMRWSVVGNAGQTAMPDWMATPAPTA